MSLATFKKKSLLSQHKTKISGTPPGGIWMTQGPYGPASSLMYSSSVDNYGPSGFSINGGRRSAGYIGQSMAMSKNGTPFKGAYPRGHGKPYVLTKETQPIMNAQRAEILGDQYKYIKPSVLSTRGMLRKKYRWAYTGTYPNAIVQSNYGNSNLAENTSQGVYLQKKSAANVCIVETNHPELYEGNVKTCTTVGGKCIQNHSGYTKNVHNVQTSGQYTLQVQRCVANPSDSQKPFPPPVNTGKRGCATR